MPQFQTFKDLNVSFKSHPITKDLVSVRDNNAIKQSIVNLLLTNRGERLFNPNIGSDIRTLLFEPMDYGVAAIIKSKIVDTLTDYEPRIRILELYVIPNFDTNGFEVSLEYEIIGREDTPINVEFFLERTR